MSVTRAMADEALSSCKGSLKRKYSSLDLGSLLDYGQAHAKARAKAEASKLVGGFISYVDEMAAPKSAVFVAESEAEDMGQDSDTDSAPPQGRSLA